MHSTSATTLLAADQRAWNDVVGAIDLAERIVARAEAERMRALAAAGRLVRDLTADTPTRVREHDMVLRSLSAEIGAVARRSDRSVQRDIGDAIELVEHYPATLSRWEAGDITRAHVRTIVDCGAIVPIDARADFDKDAAALATHHSPGRLRRLLEQLADDMHPRSLVERHVDARAERCVRVVARGEGMSDLIVTTPTLLADAVYDRLTQQARVLIDTRAHVDAGADVGAHSCVDAADTRSIDQVRADLVTDMLLTVAPSADPTRTDDGPGALGAIRAKVQIVVPVATLLGDDDRSAELAGRSPLDADTARRLAGATRCPWERVLTHPITGAGARRRHLPATGRPRPLPSRPRPALPIPRMPRPRRALRSRPHHRLGARRQDRGIQSRPPLPTAPLDEAVHRVDRASAPGRHPRMDLTRRPNLPRPPRWRRRARRHLHARSTRRHRLARASSTRRIHRTVLTGTWQNACVSAPAPTSPRHPPG